MQPIDIELLCRLSALPHPSKTPAPSPNSALRLTYSNRESKLTTLWGAVVTPATPLFSIDSLALKGVF